MGLAWTSQTDGYTHTRTCTHTGPQAGEASRSLLRIHPRPTLMHRPVWLGNFQISLLGECSSLLGTFCTVLFQDRFYPHFTLIPGTP